MEADGSRCRKINRGIQSRKEEVKQSLFADDKILCIENLNSILKS